VTETHPKALLKALRLTMGAFSKKYGIEYTSTKDDKEHDRRDAVISAVAAREGFLGRWPNDLSTSYVMEEPQPEWEQDPNSYWLRPVHYFWPEGPR
jgi:hypothetical protein